MTCTLLTFCIHLPVPVQDNNGVERTFGDCAVRKKYSHIDLIHMIDGVETQKATICAGNRCYYLKVCTSYLMLHSCNFFFSRMCTNGNILYVPYCYFGDISMRMKKLCESVKTDLLNMYVMFIYTH